MKFAHSHVGCEAVGGRHNPSYALCPCSCHQDPENPFDPVDNPQHYVAGRSHEPIDVIEDWGLGYHLGSAVKYLSRAGRKGDGVEDARKAIWYIERWIEQSARK